MIARRGVLAAIVKTALAVPPASASVSTEATSVAAHPADAFVESVGVCTHLSSEPYASKFAAFRALIGASGIRHLRDELRPSNDLARWKGLYADFGIRGHLLASPVTNSAREMMDYLAALGAEKVTAIEGQNEGDSEWFKAQPQARPDWSAAVVAYQRAIYRALRARYTKESLPVLSPSVLDYKPADARLIRGAAPYCDVVAIHPYVQHGQEPETNDDYAALGWYLRNMRDPFKPGAPVMATEAGYCTVARPGGSGVSEAAAATYLPRLLLHNFGAGVLRTFLYEFMDGGASPTDPEDNYGLVRSDGSPKPAYAAIRNLLRALDDRGTPFAPNKLDISLASGAAQDARTLLFQKRDEGFILALWLAVRSWDAATGSDLAVAPQRLTVTLKRPLAGAALLVPQDGAAWSPVPLAHGRVSVPVSDKVTLLRLLP